MQSELGTNTPLSNKDDIVQVMQLRLERTYFDTIILVDTLLENGVAVYDSTFEYKETGTGASQSQMSNNIFDTYLTDMESAADVTMFNSESYQDVYVNGVKVSINLMYSDARYWHIFDHKIIEGRVFDEAEVDAAAPVIVISTLTAQNYFGREENVVDEEMFIDGKTYKVIGLYPNLSLIHI